MIPCDNSGGHCDVQNRGITTLDYFAAAVMPIVAEEMRQGHWQLGHEAVKRAYDLASLMIDERGCRP